MSGCVRGVQTLIRKEAELATYVHCSSHILNLILNTANSVSEIRNMFGTVKEVTNFINESAKRRAIAEKELGADGGRCLVTLCETRFVERHDALLVFADHYSHTLAALDVISCRSADQKAVGKARALAKAMVEPSFIVALCCAQKVMSLTIVLSRSLQKMNLFEAVESVDFVMRTLCEWRKTGGGNADAVEKGETVEEDTTQNCKADLNESDPDVWTGTSGVYTLATHMATTNGITLTKVRVVGRQQI